MIEEGRDLRLEINEFSDLHYNEFIKMRGGLKNASVKDSETIEEIQYEGDVATSLDWRDKNVVNDVKNQQQCGSCWAFSTIGSTESRWALKSGNLLSLSEQELVDCDSNDNGCNGGLMDNAFEWLASNSQKLDLESDYSYTGEDGTCEDKKYTGKVQVTGHKDVKATDAEVIKALQTGPLSVAVAAND
jgi:cathepsin L